MKLYLISQEINNGHDTYSDAVVAAENKNNARNTHPSKDVTHFKGDKWYGIYAGSKRELENGRFNSWVNRLDIDKVKVKYLGKAAPGIKAGVICASFHAG